MRDFIYKHLIVINCVLWTVFGLAAYDTLKKLDAQFAQEDRV